MARRRIIGGLDIGTTKVVSIVAEVSPGGYPTIVGMGECPTIGLRKGVVVDSTALVKSITQAVTQSEEMVGERIQSFFLCSPLVSQQANGEVEHPFIESIGQAGLQVEEAMPAVLASAECILSDTDKSIGTVLLDLGGSSTEVVVFNQGFPVHTFSLNVGSDHISSDLAVCLHTSISEGERIKRSLGLQVPENGSDLEISSVGGHETRQVPASAARDIIQSRVQEIFELVQQELLQNFRLEALSGGIILCGGGSQLKGLLDFAAPQINVSKMIIGTPGKISVPREEWIRPEYASSLGLVTYGAKRSFRRSGRLSRWREILDRFM